MKHTKEYVYNSFHEEFNDWQNWTISFKETCRGAKTIKNTEIIITKVNLVVTKVGAGVVIRMGAQASLRVALFYLWTGWWL